jgi:hypothetical protein
MQLHKLAINSDIHPLIKPINMHWAMQLKPIHPKNKIIVRQRQHFQIRDKLDPLDRPNCLMKSLSTMHHLTIGNLDNNWLRQTRNTSQ